jgi:uncharacterized protein YjbI with pentapeptide repeats
MTDRFEVPPADVAEQLAKSQLYSESSMKEGSTAYFAFESYEGLDLSGAVLASAQAHSARFVRCRFDGATLYHADANGICLDGCSLIQVDFRKAQMESAQIRGARGDRSLFFKTDLSEASFESSHFAEASFERAFCLKTNFRGCQLEQANFSGSLIKKADFSNASLSGANFTDAHLSKETRFHECRGLDQIIAPRIVLDDKAYEGDAALAVFARLASTPD